MAIGVQCSQTTSCIYLFAIDGARIIHAIEIEEKLTSCCFIESQICVDSALNSFNGCIIVGTETAKVIIIDFFVDSCIRVLKGLEFFNNEPKLCKIVSSRLPFESIEIEKFATDRDEIAIGILLEARVEGNNNLLVYCLVSFVQSVSQQGSIP